MHKNDFLKEVKEALGLSSVAQANTVVTNLTDLIERLVKAGEEVSLGNLGKFSLTVKEARKVRNPINNELIDVPKKNAIKFKPSSAVKKSINE